MTDNSSNHIYELAEYLAYNYVYVSFNNKIKSDKPKIKEYLKITDNPLIKRSRNIFVLGAGASINGYPGIFKNALSAADQIEKGLNFNSLKNRYPEISDKEKELEKKILLGKRETNKTFETRLSILSNFYPISLIREKIQLIFGYKTFPSKFYELLAHLFKNRFVDAVINFNFDETFDQSVIEEIGPGQYKRIISDGDCVPYKDLIHDLRLKIPLYIKPHGTASEKSSLRFTKEQYIDIPRDIEKLILELFTAQSIESETIPHEHFDVLNLVICGFELESIEFNEIIKQTVEKTKDKKVQLFFIEYEQDPNGSSKDKDKNKKLLERLSFNEKKKNFEIKIIYLKSKYKGNEIKSLDNFIEILLKECFGLFETEFTPREPVRHDILLQIFQNKVRDERNKTVPTYFNSPKYMLDRLIFEILIVACKNHGVVQLEESLKSSNRIGIYYEYLLNFNINNDLNILDTIFTALGFKTRQISFGRGIYKININEKERVFDFIEQHVHDNPCNIELTFSNTKEVVDFKNGDLISDIRTSNLQDYFYKFETSTNANLYPNFSNVNDHIFKNITKKNIICTDLALHNYKKEGINNCNTVFAISDKGLSLKAFQSEIWDKKIDCYAVLAENQLKLLEETEKMKITKMPFYDHSRHMILFLNLDENQNKENIHSGIFYYKKGFSNNINALYLDSKENKETLYKTFLTYWMKSEYYAKYGSLPYIKDSDDIKRIYSLSDNVNSKLQKLNKDEFNPIIQKLIYNEYKIVE